MKRFLCGLLALWIMSVVGIIILFGCEKKINEEDDSALGTNGDLVHTFPVTPEEPIEYTPIDTTFSGKPVDVGLKELIEGDSVRHVIVGDSVSVCRMVSYTEKSDISALLNALNADAEFYEKGAAAYTHGVLKQYLSISIYLDEETDSDRKLYVLPDGTAVYSLDGMYYITPSGAFDYRALYPMSPAGREESWQTLSSSLTPSDMLDGRNVVSAHFGGSMYSSHLSLPTGDKELIDRALTELCAKEVIFTERTEDGSVITVLTLDACSVRLTLEGGDELCFYITADGAVLIFSDGYYYRTSDGVVNIGVFMSLHYGT